MTAIPSDKLVWVIIKPVDEPKKLKKLAKQLEGPIRKAVRLSNDRLSDSLQQMTRGEYPDDIPDIGFRNGSRPFVVDFLRPLIDRDLVEDIRVSRPVNDDESGAPPDDDEHYR